MPDPMPVIVGVPRSGTTLLRMMVDAHAEVAIPPETGFLPALADLDPAVDAREAALADHDGLSHVARLRTRSRHPARGASRRVGNARPTAPVRSIVSTPADLARPVGRQDADLRRRDGSHRGAAARGAIRPHHQGWTRRGGVGPRALVPPRRDRRGLRPRLGGAAGADASVGRTPAVLSRGPIRTLVQIPRAHASRGVPISSICRSIRGCWPSIMAPPRGWTSIRRDTTPHGRVLVSKAERMHNQRFVMEPPQRGSHRPMEDGVDRRRVRARRSGRGRVARCASDTTRTSQRV